MDGNDKVFVICLNILRWLGLSFTGVETSSRGEFVANHSDFHLFFNLIVAAVFLFLFSRISLNASDVPGKAYKASTIVFLLYTKMVVLAIVMFSVCGNVYNRKFVDVINPFRVVTRRLERVSGHLSRRRGKNGVRILVQFFLYLGVVTGLNVWADGHIPFYIDQSFRAVQYVCSFYVTLFTAHFVVTMNYIREAFGYVNDVFGRLAQTRGGVLGESERKKLRLCMESFMELREVESVVNEVFGKQIFLTLLLAFSGVIVNVYYFMSLNLYGTSNAWLNASMLLGFFQSVAMAVMGTRAAESAVAEANRMNEIIFGIHIDWSNWPLYYQMKYFVFFNHHYPMEFRAWVFYALNYDSLFKVILTSSVIATVILQCDFLRESVLPH